ncbi:ACT domain-containing protein ACR1-like isoform X1 [Primulina tabacum]|uniref:ACT domain-containing protein ACR1-like isoform X1 n=1 Tax=Primulina tabacum TaxID=48773 RepID=UPI003F596A83
MDISYKPSIHPEFEELMERIHPPRVCIDNDTFPGLTLVKVDSTNKHGMLLEIVQVLTDLDLVISKSYISSDGGWLMDVFHVTDQKGGKITDQSVRYRIHEGICASRRVSRPQQLRIGQTALEMTGIDRPGLMSEMSAALAELGCDVSSAMAWTHNNRAACIIYVDDKGGPITDPSRVAQVQAQLENVVEAHHYNNERRSVRLTVPAMCQTHTERRLHQLMAADRDYEECCSCCRSGNDDDDDDVDQVYQYEGKTKKECEGTHVKIDKCKENGYSAVTIRCRDRPKLLYDTLCTLTDLHYVVFHATMSSNEAIAFQFLQEYYIRHENGCTLDSEAERLRVTQCLVAATERRNSHGLRLDICVRNRTGWLSDVTRVFRESGLSITRAEIGTRGENAVGTFYVKDISGQKVNPETLEMVTQEIGGSIVVSNTSSESSPEATSPETTRSNTGRTQQFSLGNFLREQLERLSSNFRPIKGEHSPVNDRQLPCKNGQSKVYF